MSQLFRNYGIQFRYPDDWTLHEEEGEEQVTLTVSRDPACFWSLTLLEDQPDPAEVLDEAIDAYREEYPDLDVSDAKAMLARRPAVACDLEFFCHDLCNTARLRAIQTPRHTLFLMCQMTDHEEGELDSAFEEMNRSLEVDLPG
jgi:hypothetical protein